MKKLLVWLVMAFLAGTAALDAEAAWFSRKKETPKEEAPAAKAMEETVPAAKVEQKKQTPVKTISKDQQKALEAKRLLVAEKRKRLNNTEWQIELRPLAGSAASKEKRETDVLFFKDNEVSVSGFQKKEFSPTNYTLTLQDDGTVIWETMQNSPVNGVAFWRGEMDPDMTKMQGILSYHLDEKTIRDYSFVSLSKSNITPVAGGN